MALLAGNAAAVSAEAPAAAAPEPASRASSASSAGSGSAGSSGGGCGHLRAQKPSVCRHAGVVGLRGATPAGRAGHIASPAATAHAHRGEPTAGGGGALPLLYSRAVQALAQRSAMTCAVLRALAGPQPAQQTHTLREIDTRLGGAQVPPGPAQPEPLPWRRRRPRALCPRVCDAAASVPNTPYVLILLARRIRLAAPPLAKVAMITSSQIVGGLRDFRAFLGGQTPGTGPGTWTAG